MRCRVSAKAGKRFLVEKKVNEEEEEEEEEEKEINKTSRDIFYTFPSIGEFNTPIGFWN